MTRIKMNIGRILSILMLTVISSGVLANENGAVSAKENGVESAVVNINDASETELAYLPGVGPSTASNIIAYRKSRPFRKPMHLMRVKGIGRKTFAKLKPFIVIEGPTTATKKIRIQTP
jgi:competence ComEA-like helix-hairpin-helix protein